MEKTQKGRLLEFVAYLGMSNNQFEKSIGASCGTIAHMNRLVSAAVIKKVTNAYPMFNSVWLLTGDGSMILPQDNVVNNAFATGGSAASIYGNAVVGGASSEDDKKRIAELEAEVQELKARLYDLMTKK